MEPSLAASSFVGASGDRIAPKVIKEATQRMQIGEKNIKTKYWGSSESTSKFTEDLKFCSYLW